MQIITEVVTRFALNAKSSDNSRMTKSTIREMTKGEELVGAYKRVAQIERKLKEHPLSTSMPFNPLIFLSENAVTRERYSSMPKAERAKLHAHLIHGLFANQAIKDTNTENTELYLESLDARIALSGIQCELRGRTVLIDAVSEDDFPIALMRQNRKPWGERFTLVEKHVWQRGSLVGPLDAHEPAGTLVFGQQGRIQRHVEVLDEFTLSPRVDIRIED